MKIRIDRASLADAVTWVALAVPKKHSAPALAGIRFTATADSLTLHAFDYETSHSAVLSCDVLDEGEVLASAALARQIIAALKGKSPVELSVDGNRLTISQGRSTYRLGTLSLADYPRLPAMPAAVGEIEAGDFAEVVAVVEHAASRDKGFEGLAPVHLSGDGEYVAAVATDRFRIAWAQVPGTAAFEVDVLAGALGPALKPMRGTLTLGHDGGLFGVTDGRRSVTLRTFDADFPKLDQVAA